MSYTVMYCGIEMLGEIINILMRTLTTRENEAVSICLNLHLKATSDSAPVGNCGDLCRRAFGGRVLERCTVTLPQERGQIFRLSDLKNSHDMWQTSEISDMLLSFLCAAEYCILSKLFKSLKVCHVDHDNQVISSHTSHSTVVRLWRMALLYQ